MSSTESPAILLENPKGENESWEAWGERLAEKYKTPAATPKLPLVPGHDKLRTSFQISPVLILPILIGFFLAAESWNEYGTQWKDYYNTKVAGKPLASANGPTLPALPTTEATGADWAAWGKAVGEAWTDYAASKGIDLAEVVKGLKLPQEPANEDWAAYAAEWNTYGDQVAARFKAALAAKSA